MDTIGLSSEWRVLTNFKRFTKILSYWRTSGGTQGALFARVVFLSAALALAAASQSQAAVSVLSGPSFAKASNAPLSGVLTLTTDQPSRVSVTVADGFTTWTRDFYRWGTDHAIPLFGFKPDRTNSITVTVYGADGVGMEATGEVEFITAPLPDAFPLLTLLKSLPERMEPGYTLMRLDVQSNKFRYAVIVDQQGEVVWYNETPSAADLRQLENGNLFMPTSTNILEMNLLGEVVNTWTPPAELTIDPHDALMTERGTILYLAYATNLVSDYPTS